MAPVDDGRVERQDEPGADEAGQATREPTVAAAAAGQTDPSLIEATAAPQLGGETDVRVDPADLDSGADPVASADPAAMVDTPDGLGGTAGGNAGGAG